MLKLSEVVKQEDIESENLQVVMADILTHSMSVFHLI